MNEWYQIVIALVGAALVWGISFGERWLKSRVTNRWADIFGMAADAARTAVESVQQTLVDDLKAAGGGKLTPEQKSKAFCDALAAAKKILGTEGLEVLKAAIAGGEAELEEWLKHHIESSVAELKS